MTGHIFSNAWLDLDILLIALLCLGVYGYQIRKLGFKKWRQQFHCDHHWHWSDEQKSLCGDVVCCRCGKEEEPGAIGLDPIGDGPAMKCRIDWPFGWLLSCPKCENRPSIQEDAHSGAFAVKCGRCHHMTRYYYQGETAHPNPFRAAVDEWQRMDRIKDTAA